MLLFLFQADFVSICRMNYREALEYMYAQLPMFQRIGPAAYKKDLTNTIALLDVLGHPEQQFACIHVGGTNGKGSVSNMLASICAEAGYTTGLYTSPHLVDFRERIRVNGVMCDEAFVAECITNLQTEIERIKPSFFEITVAMAFAWFAKCDVDIAIIEVGLGGRLDSTNVITPLVSVITNISFDHMQMLGNTLPEIAFEKAGIIKPGIPVVIGESHPETMPVFEKQALQQQSTLFAADENVHIELLEQTTYALHVHIDYLAQLKYPHLECPLTGLYQLKNLATVIQAVEVMRMQQVDISDDAVYEGIKQVYQNTGFAGRWQVLQQDPLVVADCAHNSGGLALLFEQVRTLTYTRLHIVTGAVQDKDLDASLSLFPVDAVYYFCRPDIPRGLDSEGLQAKAATYNLTGKAYTKVSSALENALQEAGQNDCVLICGSIFVVAEALPAYAQWRESRHSS